MKKTITLPIPKRWEKRVDILAQSSPIRSLVRLATELSMEPTLIYSILGGVGLSIILLTPDAILNSSLQIPGSSHSLQKYDWFAALMIMVLIQTFALFKGKLRTQMGALFAGVFVWPVVGRLLWLVPPTDVLLSLFSCVCCVIFCLGCVWGYLRIAVFPKEPRQAILENWRKMFGSRGHA